LAVFEILKLNFTPGSKTKRNILMRLMVKITNIKRGPKRNKPF